MGLNNRILYANNGVKIRGPSEAELPNFSLVARDNLIGSPSYTQSTIDDAVVDVASTSIVIDKEFYVMFEPRFGTSQSYSVTNLSPSVVSLSGNVATRISNGTATIQVDHSYGKFIKSFAVTRETTLPPNRLNSWVSGSLAWHSTDAVDTRLSGKTASDSTLNIWSTYNNSTASYTRNANIWCSGVDLTCISAWTTRSPSNDPFVAYRGGALVTPKHWLHVAHFAAQVGDQVRFVGADNTLYTRTVTARSNITVPGFPALDLLENGGGYDVNLCLLDSALPSNVKPCKVLGSDYLSKLPTSRRVFSAGRTISRIPAVYADQRKKLHVMDFEAFMSGYPDAPSYFNVPAFREPIDSKRLEFYKLAIANDSGSPVFLIINDELVLLCCLTWPTAGKISYASFVTELDAAIVSMGSDEGYRIQRYDLSGFPTY